MPMKSKDREDYFERHQMDRGKRHHKGKRHCEKKREDYLTQESVIESSEYNREIEKKYHNRNKSQVVKYKKEKIKYEYEIKGEGGKRHNSATMARRKDMHRNSPVELVISGCRNTDSSSSNESSEENIDNFKNKRRRRQRDESVERLSRKKRRIESKLNALAAEEDAEYNQKHHHSRKISRLRDAEVPDCCEDGFGHLCTEWLACLAADPIELGFEQRVKISSLMELVIGMRRLNNSSQKQMGHCLHAVEKYQIYNMSRCHHSKQQEKVADRPIKKERLSDDEERKRHNQHRLENRRQKRSGSPLKSSADAEWGKTDLSTSNKDRPAKDKPNFEVSGKLAEDTNTYNGVVIKYNEPSEARKPKRRWRLYPFKGESSLPFIPVHRQSAYLFGRTRLIADIPIDHPSCSKQHAVLQFRLVDYKRVDGTIGKCVRPYIIDLESSNGTFVNNKKIDPRRYTELMEKDVVKFGFSTREYVMLHEESKNEEEDDDVRESESDD